MKLINDVVETEKWLRNWLANCSAQDCKSGGRSHLIISMKPRQRNLWSRLMSTVHPSVGNT